MIISDQLRDAADLVEQGESFICHALAIVNKCHYYDRTQAAEFLLELGMTLNGGGFMSRIDHTGMTCHRYDHPNRIKDEEAKELRVAWCHFAADIYDEWSPE